MLHRPDTGLIHRPDTGAIWETREWRAIGRRPPGGSWHWSGPLALTRSEATDWWVSLQVMDQEAGADTETRVYTWRGGAWVGGV